MNPLLALLGATLALDPGLVEARLAEASALRARRLFAAPAIPAAVYAKVAGGAFVTGVDTSTGGAPITWGAEIIDVNIDDLWAALNDETRHIGITPLSYAAVLRGRPCADDRWAMMVMPVPVLDDRWMINHNRYNLPVSRETGGAVRELTWEAAPDPSAFTLPEAARPLVEGAVYLTVNRGAWWLIALDDQHTLAEYASATDPGGVVPVGAASSFASAGLDKTFDAMARYARAGKLPCKGKTGAE